MSDGEESSDLEALYASDESIEGTFSKPEIETVDENFEICVKSVDEMPSTPVFVSDRDYIVHMTNKESVNSSLNEDPSWVFYVSLGLSQVRARETGYFRGKPIVYAWVNLVRQSDTEFPTVMRKYFEHGYTNITKTIQFESLSNPTPEKLKSKSMTRRELSESRFVFHYIGYSFPTIDNHCIFLNDPNLDAPVPVHLSSILSYITPPAVYIFDADNSGSLLGEMMTSLAYSKDWLCFCSCSAGEHVPLDLFLPRDILTSFLLTPVEASLTCHALKHYRTAFPDSQSFFEIQRKLTEGAKAEMSRIGESIAEAVASEFLSPDLFAALFRMDNYTAVMFRRFIIAQYHLYSLAMHPVSYPALPRMHGHPMWDQWIMILDNWLSCPSEPHDFFGMASQTFSSQLSIEPLPVIDKSLLSLTAWYVDKTRDTSMYSYLSKYAVSDPIRQSHTANALVFKSLFEEVVARYSDHDLFLPVAILLLCAVREIPLQLYYVEYDRWLNLIDYIFTAEADAHSSLYTIALSSYAAPFFPSVTYYCTSTVFIQKLVHYACSVDAYTLSWVLVFIKNLYGSHSISEVANQRSGLGELVLNALTHKNPQCRAAAVYCLSSCMSTTLTTTDMLYIVASLSLCFDSSPIVRFELLRFITRVIAAYPELDIHPLKEAPSYLSTATFSHVISNWLGPKVSLPLDYEGILTAKPSLETLSEHISLALEYLTNDPYSAIKQNATTFKEALKSHSVETKRFDSSVYWQSLLNTPYYRPPTPPYESEQLLDIMSRHLLRNDSPILVSPLSPRTEAYPGPSNESAESIAQHLASSITLAHRSLRVAPDPLRAVFHPETDSMFIVTSGKVIIHIEEDLQVKSCVSLGDFDVCDIRTFTSMNNSYVLTSTLDGCIHLWDPADSYPTFQFRGSPNYRSKNLPLLADVNAFTSSILSARGVTGLTLWDIRSQKIVQEWHNVDSSPASALSYASVDMNVALLGTGNGSILSIDTRVPGSQGVSKIHSSSIGDKVIKFQQSGCTPDKTYIATSGGKFFSLDLRTMSVDQCNLRTGQINNFAVSHLSDLLLCSSGSEPPQFFTPEGKSVYKFSQVSPGAIVACHSKRQTAAFVCQSGEVLSYRL